MRLRTKWVAQASHLRETIRPMYAEGDTIVASATPTGESAIAIVRLSGPACTLLSGACTTHGCTEARKAVYGPYKAIDGHVVDYCVFVRYEAGASYTGEEMLEIYSHGNPLIVRQIVDDMLVRGCRAAEAGEFTRRAFLNGKMDLTQAEAVQDMISARSVAALEAARRQLDGSVGRAVNALLERLINVIASIEAYIDFPEEDLPPETEDGPIAQLVDLQQKAKALIATSPYSSMLREGARTVIAGAPNAGKSSLLNALLGEERAIVSAEPGTTRDYIEARLIVGRHLLRVVDTAGLRSAKGDIESKGIEKSIEQIKKAHLVLLVVDATVLPPPLPFRVEDLRCGSGLIVVENKCDLSAHVSHADFLPGAVHVSISALNGDGVDKLREAIVSSLDSHFVKPGQDDVLVSARHAEALNNMSNAVEAALDKLRTHEPPELAASELRNALASLEEIVGKIDNERILDKIFSTFCIGK
jgi:tRNA modification GTPase